MIRGLLAFLGLGLLALWLAGIVSPPYAYSWITWVDGAAGLIAIFLSFGTTSRTPRATQIVESFLLAIGLFGIWVGGLYSAVNPWQTWWTFVFACLAIITAVVAAVIQPRAGVEAPTVDRVEDRNRAA